MKPEKRVSEEKPEKMVEYSRDQLIDEILKAKAVHPSLCRVLLGWTKN
jgi:hypothetical protein